MDAPRVRTSFGTTVLEGPVEGSRCPACGDRDAIYMETEHEPMSREEAVLSRAMGVLGMIASMVPRSSVRLRCAECDCRFPRPLSRGTRYAWAGAALALLVGAGAVFFAHRGVLTAWLASVWRSQPGLFILVGTSVLSGVALAAIIRAYPSRRPPARS